MSPIHLHLMVGHVPVLGVMFGLALLAYGLAAGRQETLRVSLAVLVLAAIAGGVGFLSGEAAEEAAEEVPRLSHDVIEEHEEGALVTAIAAGALGLAALFGLWAYRSQPLPRGFAAAVLLGALVVSGLMAWTANLGGKIGHEEIQTLGPGSLQDDDQ